MKKQDDEQLPGQLSVFDLLNEGRPCDYSWQREIGQMVELDDGTIGTITKIEPYYTEVLTKNGLMVGTPTTVAPHDTFGDKMRKEGYTNAYDRMPDHDCDVAVVDHEGHRFKTRFYVNEFGSKVFDATKGRGYDICWWKELPPQTMQDYIGKCKYCMWYGYGLYSPYGNKRKEGTEEYNCQWEMKRNGIPPRCKKHDFWKPSIYSIPKLCGNCKHSNCFHYQKKEQYKEYDAKAFSDPVEEPNIYCTRDEGSVNRSQPFKEFYSQHFGACLWDRQHEWDTCEAWEKDKDILREEQT